MRATHSMDFKKARLALLRLTPEERRCLVEEVILSPAAVKTADGILPPWKKYGPWKLGSVTREELHERDAD